MKKLLIGAFLCFYSASLLAQEPLMVLTEKISDDELEYEKYFYNSDFLMDEKLVLYSDGIEAKEIYHYNSDNQIIKIDGHQKINNQWVHTYYVDYFYDADGNISSRANYNSFGTGVFELGGIYEYDYEDNRRVAWRLFMSNNLVGQGSLIYDNDGKLLEEIGLSGWSGTLENEWREAYVYNQNGLLDRTEQYFWNGSSWSQSATDQFYYDAQDNCVKWEHLADNLVTNKFEYEYSFDYTKEELILPSSPEDGYEPFRWISYRNQLVLSHWYTLDDNDVLIYICDFLYNYTPIDLMGVADNNFAHTRFSVFPNPASHQVTLLSEGAEIKNISVIDMTGKTVIPNTRVNNNNFQLDVSNLAPGAYVIKGLTSKGSLNRKIIVTP